MVTQFSLPITHHSKSIFSLTQNKTCLVSIPNHISHLFNPTFCQNCGPHPLTLHNSSLTATRFPFFYTTQWFILSHQKTHLTHLTILIHPRFFPHLPYHRTHRSSKVLFFVLIFFPFSISQYLFKAPLSISLSFFNFIEKREIHLPIQNASPSLAKFEASILLQQKSKTISSSITTTNGKPRIDHHKHHQQPHKIQPSNTLTTEKPNPPTYKFTKTQNQTQTHRHSKPNSNMSLYWWNLKPELLESPKFIVRSGWDSDHWSHSDSDLFFVIIEIQIQV